MYYHRSLDLVITHTLNHCHKSRQLAPIVGLVWRSITLRLVAYTINTSHNESLFSLLWGLYEDPLHRDWWPTRSTPLTTRAFSAVANRISTTGSATAPWRSKQSLTAPWWVPTAPRRLTGTLTIVDGTWQYNWPNACMEPAASTTGFLLHAHGSTGKALPFFIYICFYTCEQIRSVI
jgi:hypothetical protein